MYMYICVLIKGRKELEKKRRREEDYVKMEVTINAINQEEQSKQTKGQVGIRTSLVDIDQTHFISFDLST